MRRADGQSLEMSALDRSPPGSGAEFVPEKRATQGRSATLTGETQCRGRSLLAPVALDSDTVRDDHGQQEAPCSS